MAKITMDLATTRRGPSFKKAIYHYERRGTLVAARWPGPRGPANTPQARATQKWFQDANLQIKSGAPQQLIIAMQATAGTPFLPRDLLMTAMSGRLFAISEAGDRMYMPTAARIDISASLDILGFTEGDILVRHNEIWLPIPQGAAGQVLTSNGPGSLPTWETP